MQRGLMPAIIVLVVLALTTTFALVTSISSLASPASAVSPSTGHFQGATPAPTEADASVAGSTDGIVWMGIVVALIVVLPLLVNRSFWSRLS